MYRGWGVAGGVYGGAGNLDVNRSPRQLANLPAGVFVGSSPKSLSINMGSQHRCRNDDDYSGSHSV